MFLEESRRDCACLGKSCAMKTFKALLDQQAELCTELEELADSLPDRFDTHLSLGMAQRLLPAVKRAHAFEEDTLFPLLVKRAEHAPDFVAIIERLKYEHWGDEDFAEQVFHQIREFVTSRKPDMAEMLAWTLRGFFENMRRHIEFEREYLLPYARACV